MAIHVEEFGEPETAVTGRQNQFHVIALGKLVLDVDLGQPAVGVVAGQFADEALPVTARTCLEVILVILIRMALQKSVGIAAVGQVLQGPEGTGIERFAGKGIVDGALGEQQSPSQIRDLLSGRVIRAG